MIDFDEMIIMYAFILWIPQVMLLRFKFKKTMIYLIFYTIFYIYICFVLKYTQFPIFLSEDMKSQIGQNVFRDMNLVPLLNISTGSFKTWILNIILTVPFGFGFPFIKKVSLKDITIVGGILGCILEGTQLVVALIVGFTFRYVDINDFIFNFVGVIIGYLLFRVFIIRFRLIVDKFDIQRNPFLDYIYDLK